MSDKMVQIFRKKEWETVKACLNSILGSYYHPDELGDEYVIMDNLVEKFTRDVEEKVGY